jgi:hypothetical protein
VLAFQWALSIIVSLIMDEDTFVAEVVSMLGAYLVQPCPES